MGKKYLKGFANFGYALISTNTTSAYKAGTIKKMEGAKSCTPTDNRSEFSINADDGVWDSGSEWTDTTNEITVVEADLATIAELTGAEIDEETNEIEESTLDNAPEVALTYSALRADGGYRLYRYYSARCTSVKVSHTTKGDSNDAQTYALTFKCSPRKIDKKIRGTKDIDNGDALTWLDTIPSLPVVGG